jgi:hypothetical protein
MKNEITVQDIQKAKDVAAGQIRDALEQFHESTGLIIDEGSEVGSLIEITVTGKINIIQHTIKLNIKFPF